MSTLASKDAEKPKKAIAKYKFNKQWLDLPQFNGWLQIKKEDGKEFGFCSACKQKIIAHKVDLERHSKSAKHLRNCKAIVGTQPIQRCLHKNSKTNSKRAEIKLVGLLATNDLPFLLIDSLVPVLKSTVIDSETVKGISLHRTKATGIMKNVLGKHFSQTLIAQLKETYFSIIMDETTDVSGIKQCAFTVIFYDNVQSKVITSFFDLKECKSGTALNLFTLLKDCIVDKKISFDNLIGFSADSPNVMFGEKNSVSTLLKKEKPSIVTVKCSCHLIHLVSSKASLKLPNEVEDLLRNLGAHFNRSFLRQENFKEFQHYFSVEIHKILSATVTRWLSINACVDRILEQYEPLRAYLRLEVFEDPSATTETMLETMNNPSTKIYLEFMSYSTGILTDFNKLFQSERPMLYKLKGETNLLLKTFLSNFVKIQVLKSHDIWTLDLNNFEHFVDLNDLYLGVSAQISLSELSENEKIVVLTNCRNFYVEAIRQIRNKFDFSDPFYNIIDIVDPEFAQEFKLKTLISFKERFEFMEIDLQSLDNEWREHALLDHESHGLSKSLDPESYWRKVFNLQTATGLYKFPNLKKVITFLLILPFSNASVERIFSNLKICKTNLRNKLDTSTVASLLFTKQGIKTNGGTMYEPPDEVYKLNWKTMTD